MKSEEIERWLRDEEYQLWLDADNFSIADSKKALESLGRCRMLMKGLQWKRKDYPLGRTVYICRGCGSQSYGYCNPNCSIAAELNGFPRGGEGAKAD